MTHSPDERGAELRDLFFETSQELLQALNEQALQLEKTPGDDEIVRSIRRTVHTLKGDSAACGLRELSELAHQFEDALSIEGAAAHAAVAEIAFAAADLFTEMIAAYHNGTKLPATNPLSKKIQDLTSAPKSEPARKTKQAAKTSSRKTAAGKKTAAAQPSPSDASPANPPAAKPVSKAKSPWTEYEHLAMNQAQAQGQDVLHVVVKIDPHCAMPIAGRQLVQNALGNMGPVIAVRPDPKSPAASRHIEFVLASVQTAGQIAAKCKIPTIVEEVTVELMLSGAKAAPGAPAIPVELGEPANIAEAVETVPETSAPASAVSAIAPITPENLLRVEASRIDNVLNLVGELIIGKSMLQQALNEFGRRYPKELLRGKFADAMAFQARVLNDLQRSVMKIRMVPADQLFRRFPRLVRDVARQCEREVELSVSGHDTDLDKGILDAIAEPLTHLVRNAISHGIESADDRRKAGKAPQGTVRLNAYHHGNQVVVEVSDDGRGIDAQKIRAKAIQLGLTTAEESSRLTEAEILDFIFRPGFSTAEQVTEVSGRGVGMDVVQSVLHRLKASIHVETRLGQGTTFRLKLPLTLAIIKALLFWVEERLYAIPLNAVLEIARTFEGEVHQVDNYEVLQLRNQVLPLLRLGRARPDADHTSKLFVLVISVGERKYGLIVDDLEGEEELVIKALDDQTFVTDLVSGASILGDGRVVLILNLPAVVEHVARLRPQKMGQSNFGLLLTAADRQNPALTQSTLSQSTATQSSGGQA
ncbi:MAG TPA: chemotaxis protein CheA [Candidatus Sulfotelmatobacter sp.]|nr:chemotaxis protein CheA [Candidatus Sulfotelmatobacter sp.]